MPQQQQQQNARQNLNPHGSSDSARRQRPIPSSSSSPPLDDSPTTGRLIHAPPSPNPSSLSSPVSARNTRKPIPSPLSFSSAAPPTSASSSRVDFSPPPSAPLPRRIPYSPGLQADEPRSPRERLDELLAIEQAYYKTNLPGKSTQGAEPEPGDISNVQSQSDSRHEPALGLRRSPLPTMAGLKAASQAEATKGAPRNSSMDSAISAATKTGSRGKTSLDTQADPPDVASLIKTAGSAEAVIQYLLKEKQSQSLQNSQLWRLVDKQRAMILGLNRDLERALKDKEKYRKKLKEVIAAPDVAKEVRSLKSDAVTGRSIPKVDISGPMDQARATPDSPSLDSDSQKHSPIDVSMAPYPITPPADQPGNPPHSAVSELLDPSHSMPKPQEHAYDKYDHEAEDRAADAAKKQEEERQTKDLPLGTIPPSRSLPGQPPTMPPPKPPTGPSSSGSSPKPDEGLAKFPSPPPRKGPPAPLQLNKSNDVTVEDDETDSDYDDILQVDEIISDDRRGRRRTREEDEQVRRALARQEAEVRSLSKKSKSSSVKGTPVEVEAAMASPGLPPSPRQIPPQHLVSGAAPASLAGVLNGDAAVEQREISAPLLSPGLPSSPRPAAGSGAVSPPLAMSPRTSSLPQGPLSPRPPRQPIPLPPGQSVASPPPGAEPPGLATARHTIDVSEESRSSPIDGSGVFRGFMTEEYPDLLLPPNALPSIRVKVASSRMKPSRASMLSLAQPEEDPVFTLAVFSRSNSGELWRIENNSVSVHKLDQKLRQCSSFAAKAPDRSLFSGHSPAKLDARREALDQYFDEILETPLDTPTAIEFCRYLSTNVLSPSSDGASTPENATETLSTKSGPGGRPFKNGYLTKRGKNFGGWKARFFVLDGPHLKYYEAPGGAHLGTIKLPHAQIGKQSQHNENQSPAANGIGTDEFDNQYRHAFLILEPKKKDSSSHVKHVLCAESDHERDGWVEALLKWIDYREPGDEDSPVHDRNGSGGLEQRERADAKKKKKTKTQPQHEPSGSDPLIGVSYNSTAQGDLPHQGTTARPKTSSGTPEIEVPPHSAKIISGPKDMQVISDASVWGNKPSGLSVPTQEEKKARKRSFFGFGPKTRSSADGQDALYGEGGSSTPPQGGGYQGPVRQVFGASLGEAVRYNAPLDVRVPLPAVVYRCIQYLDANNALSEEGIFRLSGSNVAIKQLRERFNTEGDINLVTEEAYHDIHAVASLLKLYLRELPTTILTRDLHMEFLQVTEMTDQKEKIVALSKLVQYLPLPNATLLKYLISFLIKIINHADKNKMTVRNVGIVFSPTLNIPAPVFAMFLQHYEPIWGIAPEEYTLPSAAPETEIHEGQAPAPLTAPPPRSYESNRPGTSDHSQSPHRQRLLDSVQGHQGPARTGATPPPLLQDLNANRASPNHMNNRSTAHEPHFMTQQNQGPSRPAYEANLGMPQGYDGNYQQHSRNLNPGYDRPPYSGMRSDNRHSYAPPYEASHMPSGGGRRRESAIFNAGMIGLSNQGSKSRLRDETRY